MTTIANVTYHGGFSFLPDPTRAGRLVLDDDALTLDRIDHQTVTRNWDPPVEICRTRAIAAVEVTSEQVAKSKVGAAVLFGVLGGVTAKATMERATMVVTLKSGEVGYLTVAGMSIATLLGSLNPWLREHGITLGSSDGPQPTSDGRSVADELVKLAELHRAGALTDEEFVAHKAKLL